MRKRQVDWGHFSCMVGCMALVLALAAGFYGGLWYGICRLPTIFRAIADIFH